MANTFTRFWIVWNYTKETACSDEIYNQEDADHRCRRLGDDHPSWQYVVMESIRMSGKPPVYEWRLPEAERKEADGNGD